MPLFVLVIEVQVVATAMGQLGGGSKSINHTSMHRVKHEEINESSAHGVPVSIKRPFITVLVRCSHT